VGDLPLIEPTIIAFAFSLTWKQTKPICQSRYRWQIGFAA
jgi:hypothetical protein